MASDSTGTPASIRRWRQRMRALLAMLLFGCMGMPALGWSSFATNVEGQRQGCWAATALEKPYEGVFGIIGNGAIDGPPRLAIFLQVVSGADFGPADGMVPLSVRVGGLSWSLNARHLPVADEPRLVLFDPPMSLFGALRHGRLVTLDAPGGVDNLAVGLAGSGEAIAALEACLARLTPDPQGGPGAEPPMGERARPEPSFDCAAARAPVEQMICADAELAGMDADLAPIYARAKARAADWQFIGDGGQTALDWFNTNARQDLAWRNSHCDGRRDCLVAWFVKRKAIMLLVADSDEGFGDGGIDAIHQLDNMDTLIGVRMATHKRNVLFDASEQRFDLLPDGDIRIVSTDPLLYRVDHQKAYWKAGGAFWFSSIRDSRHRIIEIPAPEGGGTCMSKAELLDRSSLGADALALVAGDEVCLDG